MKACSGEFQRNLAVPRGPRALLLNLMEVLQTNVRGSERGSAGWWRADGRLPHSPSVVYWCVIECFRRQRKSFKPKTPLSKSPNFLQPPQRSGNVDRPACVSSTRPRWA